MFSGHFKKVTFLQKNSVFFKYKKKVKRKTKHARDVSVSMIKPHGYWASPLLTRCRQCSLLSRIKQDVQTLSQKKQDVDFPSISYSALKAPGYSVAGFRSGFGKHCEAFDDFLFLLFLDRVLSVFWVFFFFIFIIVCFI